MYILIAILVLGLLILVHELGHFCVGRWCGIKVLEFSIGFGPKLLHWGKGETEYSLRLIPLGGFCRFLGEDEDGEREAGSMLAATVWQRMATLLAGPVCNLLLAVVLASAFMWINGTYVPQVVQIESYSKAADAGLQAGDIIREVNGRDILSYMEIQQALAEGGDPVELTVSRGEERLTLSIPRVELDGNQILGITYQGVPERFSFVNATRFGCRWLGMVTRSIFGALGDLFTGQAEQGSVVGPVGTISIIAQQVQTGWLNMLLLIAMLSLNLGILNLLPVPALDGGRLIFLQYELVRGKPFPPEKEGVVHLIGMVILFSLMILLTFSDVRALFT